MDFFVEHEIEVGRWVPIGLIAADGHYAVALATAQIGWDLLPGRFRCLELDLIWDDRIEVELAADGMVVEP
jgi:hypothetical protein